MLCCCWSNGSNVLNATRNVFVGHRAPAEYLSAKELASETM